MKLETNPYSSTADLYLSRGWTGILRLNAGTKQPPPPGYTGAGSDPSAETVRQWAKVGGNIALRLPATVIGIDVDAYGSKQGGDTLRDLERRLGPLPDTYTSTSRDDGVSGIKLYRVPEGTVLNGVCGPGIEVVQHHHRYAVVWPSTHPEGRTYRWVNPAGQHMDTCPRVEDLPDLPAAWIRHLRADLRQPTADPLPGDVAAYATAGEPCEKVREVVDKLTAALFTGTHGARHDYALGAQMQLIDLGARGHKGTAQALTLGRAAFIAAVEPDRPDAAKEWDSALRGAPTKVSRPVAEQCGGPTCNANPEPPTATQPPADLDDIPAPRYWQPVTGADLWDLLNEPDPVADIFKDTNGDGLFYRAEINVLCGPSSKGKSWLTKAATAQVLHDGGRVLYFDMESRAAKVIKHLHALGIERRQADRLTVLGISGLLRGFCQETWDELLQQQWDLIVVDSFTAALNRLIKDGESNSGDSIERFLAARLQPLANTGAAVVFIDHKPKNGEDSVGGIGSERKLSGVQGAVYTVKMVMQPARGHLGQLSLTLDKDNNGYVMERLADARERGSSRLEAALVDIDSRPQPGQPATRITVNAPRPLAAQQADRLQEAVDELSVALYESAGNRLATRDGILSALRHRGVALKTSDLPTVADLGQRQGLWRIMEGPRRSLVIEGNQS